MKSIQTKILILVLSGVLISTMATAVVNIRNIERIIEDDSAEIMRLQCAEKSQQIDENLMNIEQSVNTIYHYAASQRGDVQRLNYDQDYMDDYIAKVRGVALNVVENTEGAIAVYYRLNPDIGEGPQGLFLTVDENGEFYDFRLTDIAKYDEDDASHVGWYYIPIHHGEAMWMMPYDNKNLDILMISYVIPIFEGNYVVGVIGMDIRLDLLCEQTDSVQLYDTGYAVLTDEEGNIIYHRDYPDGLKTTEYTEELQEFQKKTLQAVENNEVVTYMWNGEEKRLAAQRLRNGMIFSVCVPEKEIEAPRWQTMHQSIALIGVILVIFIVITILVTQVMVRPLRQLTEAAKKIADEDLDVSIECKTKDEVGVLAQSFQQAADHLRHYIDYINQLAHTDVLTQVGNKTAYEESVAELTKQIENKTAEFAVIVMDINNLKKMNDTYGHEKGDRMIQDVVMLCKKVWNPKQIFRIGGDEFAVILPETGMEACQKQVKEYEEVVAAFNRENGKDEIGLEVAIAAAVYEKETDQSFNDVFCRADKKMYEDKARKKKFHLKGRI